MSKSYTWTVKFTVSENWVSDGFNLTDETAQEMLAQFLPYAYGFELDATVIKAPSQDRILKAQSSEV